MLSGAVKLEDLNDFILPAQDCVVPILQSVNAEKGGIPRPTLKPNLIRIRDRNKKGHDPTINDIRKPPASFRKERAQENSVSESQNSSSASAGAAQVSLYDCLACSGCVTTAETVLLKDQSVQVFLQKLKESKLSIVSFSLQSLDYLAAHFNLRPRVCFRKLCHIFKRQLGVSIVLDTFVTDSFVLVEVLREFLREKLAEEQQQCNVENATSSERFKPPDVTEKKKRKVSSMGTADATPALVTSHCSGWICYLEKTQSSEMVKRVNKSKTSQQLLGHLVKTLTLDCYRLLCFKNNYFNILKVPIYLSHLIMSTYMKRYSDKKKSNFYHEKNLFSHDINIKDIFHATVMPCYDKKLEIHRKENVVENSISEVDTVLATVEIFELLKILNIENINNVTDDDDIIDDIFLGTSKWSFWDSYLPKEIPEDVKNIILINQNNNNNNNNNNNMEFEEQHPSNYCLCCHTPRSTKWNNSSGSFFEYLFRQSAKILYNIFIPDDEELQLEYVANRDMKEISLKINKKVVLQFLIAYGFRNIQNIMKSKLLYTADFIEIMACPQGCKAGGGQQKLNKEKTFEKNKEEEIINNDDIIFPAHKHPLLILLYRYVSILLNQDTSVLTGIYHSIIDERKQLGTIGTDTLRW